MWISTELQAVYEEWCVLLPTHIFKYIWTAMQPPSLKIKWRNHTTVATNLWTKRNKVIRISKVIISKLWATAPVHEQQHSKQSGQYLGTCYRPTWWTQPTDVTDWSSGPAANTSHIRGALRTNQQYSESIFTCIWWSKNTSSVTVTGLPLKWYVKYRNSVSMNKFVEKMARNVQSQNNKLHIFSLCSSLF